MDTRTSTRQRVDGLGKKQWLKERLTTLAELRGAKAPSPDALKALASALSGFSDSVVEQACQTLERALVSEYESKMPSLATLMDACRGASRIKTPPIEYGFYRCGRCKNTYAATKTPLGGCQACGFGVLTQIREPEGEFDHASYMRDVRPEKYVRVADVIRELVDKRRREGKPVNPQLLAAIQMRAGDAA